MTKQYLRTVGQYLSDLSASDRKHALEALAAQLEELADVGIEPVTALGDPARYAEHLRDALIDGTPDGQTQWRALGLPVETRGPVSAEVRSRTVMNTQSRRSSLTGVRTVRRGAHSTSMVAVTSHPDD